MSQTQGRGSYVPMLVGAVLMFALIFIPCWLLCWCWWGWFCCHTVTPAELIVEDIHVGSWMALDNEMFAFEEDNSSDSDMGSETESEALEDDGDYHHAEEPVAVCRDTSKLAFGPCGGNYINKSISSKSNSLFRHGMLFQMGDTEYCEGGAPRTRSHFEGVMIRYVPKPGSPPIEVVVPKDEFDWMDVNPDGGNCTIDPLHAYGMFVNEVVSTDCDDYNEPLTCSGTTPDPLYSCRRNRSMHASVTAKDIMTMWSGSEFYEMVADETDEYGTSTHPDRHVSYRFKLPNEITVDQWQEGCWVRRYERVSEIRIMFEDGDLTHMGYEHLPVDGGRIQPNP